MSERQTTFVDRVFDGHVRIDELSSEITTWLKGKRTRPLHEFLGLNAKEMELVANTPDALRYILHAKRFQQKLSLDAVKNQAQVRNYAMSLAAKVIDPFDLAEIDSWNAHVDAAAHVASEQEPSHA